MHITLLKTYCSPFSAVAAGTFNWPNDRSFTKERWTAWIDSTFFQVQSIKKKGKHVKHSVEVHNGKYIKKNMEITVWIFLFQNKLFYVIAVLVVIYMFLHFYDLSL